VFNPELIKLARTLLEKRAFIPAGDPALGGPDPGAGPPGGGGMAPPPAGDPSGGGAAGAPPVSTDQIRQIVHEAVQAHGLAGGAAAGAGAAGGAAIKPKIDVNVEIMQLKHMMAKLCDQLGVQMPAQDMTATPEKLTAMAQGQPTSASATGQQPPSALQPPGPVTPIQPMDGATPPPKTASEQGMAVTSRLAETEQKAAALLLYHRKVNS